MADITMCMGKFVDGNVCPFAESCYRYTAPKNEYYQAWFTEPIESFFLKGNCLQRWERTTGKGK